MSWLYWDTVFFVSHSSTNQISGSRLGCRNLHTCAWKDIRCVAVATATPSAAEHQRVCLISTFDRRSFLTLTPPFFLFLAGDRKLVSISVSVARQTELVTIKSRTMQVNPELVERAGGVMRRRRMC